MLFHGRDAQVLRQASCRWLSDPQAHGLCREHASSLSAPPCRTPTRPSHVDASARHNYMHSCSPPAARDAPARTLASLPGVATHLPGLNIVRSMPTASLEIPDFSCIPPGWLSYWYHLRERERARALLLGIIHNGGSRAPLVIILVSFDSCHSAIL